MNLILTRHVRQRMRQRGVTEEDIRSAIANYVLRTETPKPSIRFEGKGVSGDMLRVWCPPDQAGPDTYIVKSTAWK